MKVVFIISSMAVGGAERVVSILANFWAAKNRDIEIFTFDENAPFYELDPRVNIRGIRLIKKSRNLFNSIANNLVRISRLRSALKRSQADVVIAFMDATNVLTLLATRTMRLPVIISERIHPGSHRIAWGWHFMRRLTYNWADLIVVQTEAARCYFKAFNRTRITVIPNPAMPSAEAEKAIKSGVQKHPYRIAAMGRLNHQKGFDLLIKAFAKIKDRHPEWRVVIWGEGNERVSLENLITSLGLDNRVILAGTTARPLAYLKACDMFVLSSRYEGFPNVLCEAMLCGLPVISYDCPHGPAEIIRQGVDGILIPPEDIDALAHAMEELIGSPEKRLHLSRRAGEIGDRFGVSKIMDLWERQLRDLCLRKSGQKQAQKN